MKIALAYDYLNQAGGGERVLKVLTDLFPQAPIYTIFYDQKALDGLFSDRQIKTSFLDFPWARQHHRAFIPLMPWAIQSLNLTDQYDLIISAGAGYSSGLSYHPSTKHLHYCFTPLRYAWQPEYIPAAIKPLNPATKPLRLYLKTGIIELISDPTSY